MFSTGCVARFGDRIAKLLQFGDVVAAAALSPRFFGLAAVPINCPIDRFDLQLSESVTLARLIPLLRNGKDVEIPIERVAKPHFVSVRFEVLSNNLPANFADRIITRVFSFAPSDGHRVTFVFESFHEVRQRRL